MHMLYQQKKEIEKTMKWKTLFIVTARKIWKRAVT